MLVTVESFAEVSVGIERLVQRSDPDTLRELTSAGNAGKLDPHAKPIGEPNRFGIFYHLDIGSITTRGSVD
jgi:hypothetical protein